MTTLETADPAVERIQESPNQRSSQRDSNQALSLRNRSAATELQDGAT